MTIWDVEEVKRMYRLEKNKADLFPVEDDFYDSLNDFLKEEKQRYLHSLQELNADQAKDFSNLKRLVEEMYDLREKKIVSRALMTVRTGDVDLTGMASVEKNLFNHLLDALQKQRLVCCKSWLNGNAVLNANEPPAIVLNTFSIRILRDLPSFVAGDMRQYGPFSVGQTVSLPEKIAQMLLNKQVAEKT